MRTVFVVGLDGFNRTLLERLPDAARLSFHPLLAYDEVVRPASGTIDLEGLLATAEARLAAFEGRVDAIVNHWDFPGSVIAPILKHRRGLPGASLEAVATFEHKYWSRLVQQRLFPDLVPRFQAIDPFAADPFDAVTLAFPYWLKPVKAHSSYLGFRIDGPQDAARALPAIRAGIGHFGEPFDRFLAMVERPEEIRRVGGHALVAEEIISHGEQCTVEGWAHGDEAQVYGTVDSAREGRHRSSLSRYLYPSRLPERVRARMADAAVRLIRAAGYRDAPFNMEFFWNPRTDAIHLLEVNTRISKSHSPLFMMVDGQSHHRVAIDLALGRRPDFPRRRGAFPVAAKYMPRTFENGIVRRVPERADVERLLARFPAAMVRILVKPGTVLADVPYQDSYSYELAEIFLGGRDEDELSASYEEALALLPFEIERERAA